MAQGKKKKEKDNKLRLYLCNYPLQSNFMRKGYV